MERTRIDRRDLGLRARRQAARDQADAEAAAPLQYTAGAGGTDADDEGLARIDAVLDQMHNPDREGADDACD